jgi:hypothetical protein
MKVQNPTSTVPVDPQDPDGTTTDPNFNTTTAPTLMPAVDKLLFGGDMGAAFAALVLKSGDEQKKVAEEQRDQAMKAEENADNAEIQDMHDKADLQRIQGVVDGSLQVVQGAAQLGQGLSEAHMASEQAEAAAEKANLEQNGATYSADHQQAIQQSVNALDAGAANTKVTGAYWGASASAIGAGKSVSDGLFSGAITDKDADAKAREAAATTLKSIADDANDTKKSATDMMNKALEFYKEYVDTKAQTAMAATHRA